jgi:hypothetical protein
MEKEATPKNAKGLIQKTTDEKTGNPKKCKGAYSKVLKKRGNTKKLGQRGPLMKKGNPTCCFDLAIIKIKV